MHLSLVLRERLTDVDVKEQCFQGVQAVGFSIMEVLKKKHLKKKLSQDFLFFSAFSIMVVSPVSKLCNKKGKTLPCRQRRPP